MIPGWPNKIVQRMWEVKNLRTENGEVPFSSVFRFMRKEFREDFPASTEDRMIEAYNRITFGYPPTIVYAPTGLQGRPTTTTRAPAGISYGASRGFYSTQSPAPQAGYGVSHRGDQNFPGVPSRQTSVTYGGDQRIFSDSNGAGQQDLSRSHALARNVNQGQEANERLPSLRDLGLISYQGANHTSGTPQPSSFPAQLVGRGERELEDWTAEDRWLLRNGMNINGYNYPWESFVRQYHELGGQREGNTIWQRYCFLHFQIFGWSPQ